MQLRPIILQEIRPSRHTGFKRGPAPAHLARLLVVEDEATLDVASLHLALQDLQIVHDVLHAKLLLQQIRSILLLGTISEHGLMQRTLAALVEV